MNDYVLCDTVRNFTFLLHLLTLCMCTIVTSVLVIDVQVCLQAASNVAKHMGSVIYLDTSNSFSAQRVACFIGAASNLTYDQVIALFFALNESQWWCFSLYVC